MCPSTIDIPILNEFEEKNKKLEKEIKALNDKLKEEQ